MSKSSFHKFIINGKTAFLKFWKNLRYEAQKNACIPKLAFNNMFFFYPRAAINEASLWQDITATVLKVLHFTSNPPAPLHDLWGLPLASKRDHKWLNTDHSRALKDVYMTLTRWTYPGGKCLVCAVKVFAATAHCSFSSRSQMPDSSVGWLAFYFLSGFQHLNRCNRVL